MDRISARIAIFTLACSFICSWHGGGVKKNPFGSFSLAVSMSSFAALISGTFFEIRTQKRKEKLNLIAKRLQYLVKDFFFSIDELRC